MAEINPNSRLEAFCDGVFAIALTLLIIDIKIPPTENIKTNAELWLALGHLSASIFAFLLSFIVILITWVNHHSALKLVNRSSPHFIYANGLLLLTVVFVPFPTALLGDNIFTDHAAPAVFLYAAVFAVQAIAWNLVNRTALDRRRPLTKNEQTTLLMRGMYKKSYYAFFFYALCTVFALWFPQTIAIIISVSWIVWLIVSINIKREYGD